MALHKLSFLVRILVSLTPTKDNYIYSMLLHMLMLCHQRTWNLPSWKMLRADFAVFNEESSEMSLAVLARATLGHTTKHKVDMVDRHYKLLHKYLEARHDLMRLSNLTTRKSGFSSFDPKGFKTTKAVGGWLQSFVRALVSDKAVMYSGPTSTLNNAYNNNLEGAKATIQATSATRFWRNDFKALIRGRWIALHAQLFKNNFSDTIVGVWPGMVTGGVPKDPH